MQKVLLHDGRVKEFKNKAKAEAYAKVSNGTLVKKAPKKTIKEKIIQFKDRK